jgi:protein subunit release factor A
VIVPPTDADDPQHWRDRAAQMRELAVKMAGSEAAILMNDLATDYEKLAERAEIRANGKKPRSNGKPR